MKRRLWNMFVFSDACPLRMTFDSVPGTAGHRRRGIQQEAKAPK